MAHAVDCTSDPVDPAGDATKLAAALQQATNTGKPLTLTGTYHINTDQKVYIKKDLTVIATNAKFIATEKLDGDLFSLDAHRKFSNECNSDQISANVKWIGGAFDTSKARVSQVVPQAGKTPKGRTGTKNTGDALSIRGVITPNRSEKTEPYRLKVKHVLIENIAVNGTVNTVDNFYKAGGDSGVLIYGVATATIKNNKFYGIRDAAVYLSAAGPRPEKGGTDGVYGRDFLITGNYVERAYDAFTSKRGADNVTMTNNTIVDVVVGLSIKQVYAGWRADGVTITNNTIERSVRPISVEMANDVTITNNIITGLGGTVANITVPINAKNNKQYDGIGLYGIQGASNISNNLITGIAGKNTVGIISKAEHNRPTTGLTITSNIFTDLKTNKIISAE